MWEFVRASGTLDRNSAYLYVLLADRFSRTCAVAERDGALVGLLTGFVPPESPETYFVWQIGVTAEARGAGIASRLLDAVLARLPAARFVEATVSPSNAASRALFSRLARERNAELTLSDGYGAHLLNAPSQGGGSPGAARPHEPEPLLRVGPFAPARSTSFPGGAS